MNDLKAQLADIPPEKRLYALRELCNHLLTAQQFQRLQRLLTDLHFIEAKCAAGMTYGVVEDFSLGEGVPATASSSAKERIGQFGRFVRSQLFVLLEHSDMVLQQALLRGEPLVQDAARAVTGMDSPVLMERTERAPEMPTLAVRAHRRGVRECRFVRATGQLLSCGLDGRLVISDAHSGRIQQSARVAGAICTDTEVDTAGERVWVCADGELYLWNTMSGRVSRLPTVNTPSWINCRFLADIDSVLIASGSGHLALYACHSGELSDVACVSQRIDRWILSDRRALALPKLNRSTPVVHLCDIGGRSHSEWVAEFLPSAAALDVGSDLMVVAYAGRLDADPTAQPHMTWSWGDAMNRRMPLAPLGCTIQVRDGQHRVLAQVTLPDLQINYLKYVSSGSHVCAIGNDQVFRVWSAANLSLLQEFSVPGCYPLCFDLQESLGLLGVGGADGVIRFVPVSELREQDAWIR